MREQVDADFYWLMRQSTPSDQPLDLDKCLRLYERIYGPCNVAVVLERMTAMDREFLIIQNEQYEEKMKSARR